MTVRTILLFLTLNLLSVTAAGKDMNDRFAVFGVGAESCGNYLLARNGGGEALRQYQHFIEGYLSAFNLIVPKTYNILGSRPLSGVMQRLATYCGGHRDANFTNAVARLTEVYYSDRDNFIRDETKGWFAEPSPPGEERRKPLSW